MFTPSHDIAEILLKLNSYQSINQSSFKNTKIVNVFLSDICNNELLTLAMSVSQEIKKEQAHPAI